MRAETATVAVTAKIERCVAEFGMFTGNGGVLTGFSGGADSTALLYWLTAYCAKRGLRLAALHVNHRIRGVEAERDAAFCKTFCDTRGIEFFYRKIDVPALAEASGRGMEEAAREARYAAFDEVVSECGFDCVATAHNADDNLETVLFNLTRGASSSGLAGIPPVRGKIVRPLLYCEKSELLAYCNEQGLDYVTDSTNADTTYTRNYIRSEIIPRLERVNPAVRRCASRMCRALRADGETLGALSAGHSLAEGRETLAMLENPVLYRVLEREFGAFAGGLTLEYTHLETAAELMRSGRALFSVSLPGAVKLVGDRDLLRFESDTRELAVLPEQYSIELREGANELPHGMLLVLRDTTETLHGTATGTAAEFDGSMAKYIKPFKNIYKLFIQAKVRSDRIIGVLSAEHPRGSVKIRVRGMSRSVKNLFSERKLPCFERERLVLIRDGGGPLWIPGIALRDGCQAESGNHENTLTLIYLYG